LRKNEIAKPILVCPRVGLFNTYRGALTVADCSDTSLTDRIALVTLIAPVYMDVINGAPRL